jgi:hypothetical protein
MDDRDEITHRWFTGNGDVAVRLYMQSAGESDSILNDESLAQVQNNALEVII